MTQTPAATMQAVKIEAPGGPEVLQAVTVSTPVPRPGEVLIRVRAAGVNRPDVLQRLGMYKLPPDADPLPGLEVAGEIVALGENCNRWQVGEEVMALPHGGGYAEYCRVHESHCLRIPSNLSMVEAAAIPETYFTVHYNVFMRAALKSGETLLVHGGSSGIGTTAIQLAKAAGATVIVTAGSDDKCRFCEELGADNAINYNTEDWQQVTQSFVADSGVDVVLDMVAGAYTQKNLDVLGRDGRYVIIAFLGGSNVELNLRAVLAKRLTVTGSTLRPQSIEEKAKIALELEDKVLPLLESGAARPIIFRQYPLAQASRAHELMESGELMGKIVLTTD